MERSHNEQNPNQDGSGHIRRFQKLTDRLFIIMSPIFGVVETSIFLTRGLALTEGYPVSFQDISVTSEGVRFIGDRKALAAMTSEVFTEFLTDYLSRVIYIVRKLTGELLNDDFYRAAEDTLGDPGEVTRRVFAFRLIEQEVANGN